MSLNEAHNRSAIFKFPNLTRETYLGLPGLLADSLPDRFGNSIIDSWLARKGLDKNSFSPIERLCYIGERGMGALQFYPAYDHQFDQPVPVEIPELVSLTQKMMRQALSLDTNIDNSNTISKDTILDILRVGTSAGGVRPKVIIAINASGHVISGQSTVPPGYDYWILKFDGVTDLELGEPK